MRHVVDLMWKIKLTLSISRENNCALSDISFGPMWKPDCGADDGLRIRSSESTLEKSEAGCWIGASPFGHV